MRKLLNICAALLLVVSLALPAFAADTPYVIDDAGLLTPQQRQELNDYAEEIANEYGIAVYMMTVQDFHAYGEEPQIFDVLWNYYHDNKLGSGKDREGMILMLSMAERDFATFYYGKNTEYAFNGYGQKEQEGHFLDNFASDDWYGGFWDYLSSAERFMEKAAAGTPVRESPWPMAALFVGIACFISFIITMMRWNKMKTVSAAKTATHYQSPLGLALSGNEDLFVRREVTHRRVESTSTASASQAHTGGGGSGRSGKF